MNKRTAFIAAAAIAVVCAAVVFGHSFVAAIKTMHGG